MQERTTAPFTSTLHAPHTPVPQPIFVPVSRAGAARRRACPSFPQTTLRCTSLYDERHLGQFLLLHTLPPVSVHFQIAPLPIDIPYFPNKCQISRPAPRRPDSRVHGEAFPVPAQHRDVQIIDLERLDLFERPSARRQVTARPRAACATTATSPSVRARMPRSASVPRRAASAPRSRPAHQDMSVAGARTVRGSARGSRRRTGPPTPRKRARAGPGRSPPGPPAVSRAAVSRQRRIGLDQTAGKRLLRKKSAYAAAAARPSRSAGDPASAEAERHAARKAGQAGRAGNNRSSSWVPLLRAAAPRNPPACPRPAKSRLVRRQIGKADAERVQRARRPPAPSCASSPGTSERSSRIGWPGLPPQSAAPPRPPSPAARAPSPAAPRDVRRGDEHARTPPGSAARPMRRLSNICVVR